MLLRIFLSFTVALAATMAHAGSSGGHAAPATAHAPADHGTAGGAADGHAVSASKADDPAPIFGAGTRACPGFGPQTPRDIALDIGNNPVRFPMAPPAGHMNLCNIHLHTQAEHKGPGFSLYAGGGEHGGWRCNDSMKLTAAEMHDPFAGHGPFGGVRPGDTIEVHWVHSSCDINPGPGLGSCLSEQCSNPVLRVEAQVFLLVNDPNATQFDDFIYRGKVGGRLHQARALPAGSGDPVEFAGSTTGPSYSGTTCSPLQVTWSVRPQCLKLDIASLHRWAESGNIFGEDHAHGIRQLVTDPDLLSPL